MGRADVITLPTTFAARFRHRWAKAIRDGESFHEAGVIMELLWIIDELESNGVEVPELTPEWEAYAAQEAEEFRLHAYGYDDTEIDLLRYQGLSVDESFRMIAEKRTKEAAGTQMPLRLISNGE